jgi:hypothetical protein
MRAEILVGETIGRERLRDKRGEQGESMRAKSVRVASGEVLGAAPQGQSVESGVRDKRSGQLLLTAKAAERNKFWKGQPLAR